LKKSYSRKGKEILTDINFAAESGECVGIIGRNGCGKTTLLSSLAGLRTVDGDQFLVDGKNLLEKKKIDAGLIGYVPQNNPLIEDLSVNDNLKLWYSGAVLDQKQELENGVLHMLGIDEFANKKVAQLSGGMKKRLNIGCAMANNPQILIMDEPSASLDIECKQHIRAYVEDFKQKGGIVIMTTHELPEIEICDKLYFMKNGKLESGEYNTVQELMKQLKD
jgi:ABC-2 type transport system ATP-binding protein